MQLAPMHDEFSLPESLRLLLGNEIVAGERVQWAGAPQPGSGPAWRMTWPIVLFSIPSTAFMLFWMWTAAGFDRGGPVIPASLIFAALGLPMLALELVGLLSPFWVARQLQKRAAKTLYVITDRRVVLFNGGYFGNRGVTAVLMYMSHFFKPGTTVKSFVPEQITDIERVEHDDGSGDLIFGEAEVIGRDNDTNRPITFRAGFFTIPEVQTAELRLRALAAK